MNNRELSEKVRSSMDQQINTTGMAVPVQVLMDSGCLSPADYENWRFGRVDYLERVCGVNLHSLSFMMKEIHAYARSSGWKASWTFYRQWGRKGKKPAVLLRFSKSGDERIERQYATHYISETWMAEHRQHADDGGDEVIGNEGSGAGSL